MERHAGRQTAGAAAGSLNAVRLPMADAEVLFFEQFFTLEESDVILAELEREIVWKQESIRVPGKSVPLPRLTAWYGDPGKTYRWSGITQRPLPWTQTLLAIRQRVEAPAQMVFNSVLLNLYRNEQDSVSWHSDDEPELAPVIASVSFGAARPFQFKRIDNPKTRLSVDLTHGSLLIMRGATQQYWRHRIPKTTLPQPPRVNLTFRVIQG
ncbi:MAG TPA: alpha-ketoglutarate-dependent dioxygenase AlkB [Phototrophicaceae bacterium]|nr:alpha-ketoglutarate-dependent dioxygenase AlkB [Phototrophicaceae bacterium]